MVQVSGGALTRTSSVARQPTSNSNRENRVDTISRAGDATLLFFFGQASTASSGADMIARNVSRPARAEMSHPIRRSFELATERCADITALVYDRLFRAHPETEPMFARDTGGHIKGSMLAFAIDAILDFAGERNGTFRMIVCEVQSHEAYGTSREVFFAFFGVIAEHCADCLAPTGPPSSMKPGACCWTRSKPCSHTILCRHSGATFACPLAASRTATGLCDQSLRLHGWRGLGECDRLSPLRGARQRRPTVKTMDQGSKRCPGMTNPPPPDATFFRRPRPPAPPRRCLAD